MANTTTCKQFFLDLARSDDQGPPDRVLHHLDLGVQVIQGEIRHRRHASGLSVPPFATRWGMELGGSS
ncbi:hypothetical protein TcasGA2_TC034972 [Tribolium castaneum]|uniref:Uncharacterized protein n=1 Tax=Tribolium castaneum TaxID=7070 RepID=A0A139W9M1_TRICA|nr:hypothetical protein TcasGA2_TC034972 [Tribolium castaneum]